MEKKSGQTGATVSGALLGPFGGGAIGGEKGKRTNAWLGATAGSIGTAGLLAGGYALATRGRVKNFKKLYKETGAFTRGKDIMLPEGTDGSKIQDFKNAIEKVVKRKENMTTLELAGGTVGGGAGAYYAHGPNKQTKKEGEYMINPISLAIGELMKKAGIGDKALSWAAKGMTAAKNNPVTAGGVVGAVGGAVIGGTTADSGNRLSGALLGAGIGAGLGAGGVVGARALNKKLLPTGPSANWEGMNVLDKKPV